MRTSELVKSQNTPTSELVHIMSLTSELAHIIFALAR